MTRRIQILPDSVANQIAAGEAVERPASVVKELVENALDAGATRVDVAVERGGKRLIRVSDDGVGMGREDALLCFDRHATSKITAASDLVSVKTFGFRGEALPSIAAVARVSLETTRGSGDTGTRVRVDGGRIVTVDEIARQRGTTVEVRNPFYNAPARAKFLKSVAPETRSVSETVTALALANPRVAFSLASDGRPLLELEGVEDATGRISQVWGGEQAGTLIVAERSEGGVAIHGLVQRPDAAKPGVRRGYLFVNGRPFRATELLKAVDRGYRTTVPSRARPWAFLYLRVPGGDVDVNVHPTKAEVRFRDQNRIEALVESTVRSALDTAESSASLGNEAESRPLAVREHVDSGASQDARLEWGSDSGPTEHAAQPTRPDGQGPQSRAEAGQIALFVTGPDHELEAASGDPVLPEVGAGRRRLWQVMDTYVLVETRDGILIVDQHSAHERILFQRLMDAFEKGGEHGQRLLFPITVRLTAAEVELVEDLSGILSRAGFEVEGFGGDTVIVQSVPNPHPYFDAERAFREMVYELTHGSDLVRAARNQHERIAMTFACKSAIKAGQRLSQEEMQELFDQLFATELPHHDVHGRPTIVSLSAAELARKFGRS